MRHPLPAPAGWAPTSPCTPQCLPRADHGTGRLRVAARLVGVAVVVLGAVVGALLLPSRIRDRWLRVCSGGALRSAGIRLRVVGDTRFAAAGTGMLVVANHLSWIDVLALDAVQPVRMLAKHEVRDWPLLGGLATRTGALFVDRAGLHALPATVAATADALRSGSVVGVFPEGTTWCGAAAGHFRRAAFQAAIDAGVPVRPVATVLRLPDGTPARGAAFVGEQTLFDSLLRVLRLTSLVCELTLLPPIPTSTVSDRRELARHAGEVVATATGIRHGTRARSRPGRCHRPGTECDDSGSGCRTIRPPRAGSGGCGHGLPSPPGGSGEQPRNRVAAPARARRCARPGAGHG